MSTSSEIDISKIIKTFKTGQKNIFYMTVLGFFISICYLFIATPYYKSYISINPMGENVNSKGGAGGLQSLVSDFGVNVNIGSLLNEKPSFYIPDIVNSRVLKKAVIMHNWTTIDNESIDLINYWQINDTTGFSLGKIIKKIKKSNKYLDLNSKYMDLAIEKLTNQILVQEESSGLIVISVLMEEPELAADIANYIANYIKEYISDVTFSHSIKHRKFIEERLKYSKQDLSESEEELREFSEKNPFAVDTPELQLQRGRLIRNMEVNQQVYITLRQQYEMARINELKEIPVINILDYGEPASEKSKPRSIFIVLICIISSFFLSLAFLLIREEIRSKH